nr:phosphotidylglycerophosphate synthetase [Salmonella sp. NCTC 7297]
MQFNIPTLLTLFRVILIPFFVVVFYLPFAWAPMVSALIFCIAAITDWFDGFLARRWNQSTRFGAFLDPSPTRCWWRSPWCWLPSIIIAGG